MSQLRSVLHRCRRDERGFTMVEVLVAMMVSLIVIGAMATSFVRNNDSAVAGQRQDQLIAVAQQQIEKVRGVVTRYGFSTLALSSKPLQATDCAPSHQCSAATVPANPTDPNDFIVNWPSASPSYLIESNYNSTTDGQISNAPASGEPLEIDTTSGQVAPKVTGVAAGSGTATVYTYVTQATVPCNSAALGLACAADDVRRVTVAVLLDNASGRKSIGPNAPVYLSTFFSTPIPSNQPSSASGLRLGLNIG